ncbi:MAG: choice-of-anchor I family protein [Anaerolineae bacterium]|nr:choice-of-anchor I family protein [Anaerolineae bacterium]
MKTRLLTLIVLLMVWIMVQAQSAPEATNAVTLEPIGTYTTGLFDEGASEIAAYHAGSATLFVVNGADKTIDLINISDPAAPTLTTQIDLSEYGDAANSVAVYGDLVAVAVQSDPPQDLGSAVFFTPAGEFINRVSVGALPDMITFTPDGSKALTANEGEPNGDYTVDPEGSVSIIDLSGGAETLTDANVTTIGFTDFNVDGPRHTELGTDLRVFGPNASVAQDFEPEYIAVSADSATAFVTLQENNAVAVIDLAGASVTTIVALGYKDFNVPGNGIDAISDGTINIANYPVFGIYQPDGIAVFESDGITYLITANEGDTRDYDGFSEETELGEATLDAATFPNAGDLEALNGLEVVTTGDIDGDGDLDQLYLPGGRSFTIWDANGALVFDSGDQLEQITAVVLAADFNSTNDKNGTLDDRSTSKGPEPEDVEIAVIGDATYAFIGLERIGGVVVYDVTNPAAPVYVHYANNRDFSGDAAAGTAGDLAPEGLLFIPAENSPNRQNLLVVTNEVSGTTTIYQIVIPS